jgi:hypothetical protein
MKKVLMIIFAILAVMFLALAVYYWITPADKLPVNFPGHLASSTKVHIKHGLAALILGVGFGILAWFSSKKTTSQ